MGIGFDELAANPLLSFEPAYAVSNGAQVDLWLMTNWGSVLLPNLRTNLSGWPKARTGLSAGRASACRYGVR